MFKNNDEVAILKGYVYDLEKRLDKAEAFCKSLDLVNEERREWIQLISDKLDKVEKDLNNPGGAEKNTSNCSDKLDKSLEHYENSLHQIEHDDFIYNIESDYSVSLINLESEKNENYQLQLRIEELEKENEALKINSNDFQDIKKRNQLLQQLLEENRISTTRLQKENESYLSASEQLHESNVLNKDLLDRLKILEKKFTALKNEKEGLEHVSEELQQTKQQFETFQLKIKNLEKTNSSLMEKIRKNAHAAAEQKLSKKQNEASQRIIENLNKSLDELRAKISILKSESKFFKLNLDSNIEVRTVNLPKVVHTFNSSLLVLPKRRLRTTTNEIASEPVAVKPQGARSCKKHHK